jgi:hypothetical protein
MKRKLKLAATKNVFNIPHPLVGATFRLRQLMEHKKKDALDRFGGESHFGLVLGPFPRIISKAPYCLSTAGLLLILPLLRLLLCILLLLPSSLEPFK